ncbi:hypothetical protein [Aureibacter tunicatorum]|uniref:Membrane or secreted protein n=1 Tax=Aureibacter tunicatorum TaxID=866807 RepID=A0AAE4BRW4_9BACT|nr:hypothetical protein [Aureibacter tunicatorum]MDR6237672.1 hypothetical protein [Aureibacter tunicatorum]BDD02707.1 hypothetical protein AUTU_01900 [Aureibacter tunicatorum]
MTTVLLGIGLIGLFFVLMSVRLIFIKNGQFKGTCASQSPFLNKEGEKCGYCGKEPEHCKNKKTNLGEVEKVLAKFEKN